MTAPGAGTILIVDDDEPTRKVIGRMVAALGYDTLEAADGSEAIHQFAAHSAKIVAATLDLAMPTTNGRETLSMLSDVAPRLPIVISSGLEPGSEQLQGRLPGTRGVVYLRKPFTAAALGDALARVINELRQPGSA